MPVTRRKFISLLGASLAVAKAGVCALPRPKPEFQFGFTGFKELPFEPEIAQSAYGQAIYISSPRTMFFIRELPLPEAGGDDQC